jgi:protein dispatched 1
MASAKQGFMISMIFILIILVLATRNIILAIFAALCVGIVIVSELAIMVFMGYEVGVVESVCIVLVVGMAVDYPVHLAMSYQGQYHALR